MIGFLQARCSILAAANPIGGRYDPSMTFAENVSYYFFRRESLNFTSQGNSTTCRLLQYTLEIVAKWLSTILWLNSEGFAIKSTFGCDTLPP